jgi:hypothetical protein
LALHAIGKLTLAFHVKRPDPWPAVLGAMEASRDPGHGASGLKLLLGDEA